MIAIVLFLIVGAALVLGRFVFDPQRQVRKYVNSRPDLQPDIRNGILSGKIVLGMYPDEAVAAAGGFGYEISADPRMGFGSGILFSTEPGLRYYWAVAGSPSKPPKIPPELIFRQRFHPDDTTILLKFMNTAQFDAAAPYDFSVLFERGRAVRIDRPSSTLRAKREAT